MIMNLIYAFNNKKYFFMFELHQILLYQVFIIDYLVDKISLYGTSYYGHQEDIVQLKC